jgi:hypothetical protein
MNVFVNDLFLNLKLLEDESSKLILYGGYGSGKSVFAAQKIIHRITTEKGHRIMVVRKFANTIRESVFKQLKTEIESRKIRAEFLINKTIYSFYHNPTGNEIICVGLDDPEKLKSIVDITSIWYEEPNQLTEEEYDQSRLRMRGETKNYKQTILTFNPIDERHWLKKRFFDSHEPGSKIVHSTYKDNFCIDEEYKKSLEQLAVTNPNLYRVACLGEWGKPEVQRPYCHNFDRAKHIAEAKFDSSKQVIIGLDFNIEPFVCIMQHTWEDGAGIHQRYFKEIVINNGDLEEMASRIKESLPVISLANALFTGDATARKREISQRNNLSNWLILQKLLNISPHRLKVPRSNPSVAGTRPLVNLALNIMDIKIDPSLSLLINELQYTEADEEGNIIKKTRDKMEQRADALDVFRYFITTFHMDLEKRLSFRR